MPEIDPYDEDFDREFFDPGDEDFDCGKGPDGQCDQAGTEWCDWDCPLSSLMRAARRRPDMTDPSTRSDVIVAAVLGGDHG